jgi:hypothetical protein
MDGIRVFFMLYSGKTSKIILMSPSISIHVSPMFLVAPPLEDYGTAEGPGVLAAL